MEVVYERKHKHLQGTIVATVIENETGRYTVTVRALPPDGRELMIAVGAWGESNYQSLAEAQRGADEEVTMFGHECSEQCERWPQSLMH